MYTKTYTDNAMDFGEMLYKYRLSQNSFAKTTQKETASACNIPVESYRKYEEGHHIPSAERILALGYTLNIPPAELLSTAYPEYYEYLNSVSRNSCSVSISSYNDMIEILTILDVYKKDSEWLLELILMVLNFVISTRKNT